MIQTDNVFPRVLIHLTDEFEVRTNGTQFELVHLRENPPALAKEFKHTAISLGRFGTLDALSKSMLTKFVLYYGQESYEAQSIYAFVAALHSLTRSVALALQQPVPEEPVMPERPAPAPEPVVEVEPAPPTPKLTSPSKRATAKTQDTTTVAPRDPMRNRTKNK